MESSWTPVNKSLHQRPRSIQLGSSRQQEEVSDEERIFLLWTVMISPENFFLTSPAGCNRHLPTPFGCLPVAAMVHFVILTGAN